MGKLQYSGNDYIVFKWLNFIDEVFNNLVVYIRAICNYVQYMLRSQFFNRDALSVCFMMGCTLIIFIWMYKKMMLYFRLFSFLREIKKKAVNDLFLTWSITFKLLVIII